MVRRLVYAAVRHGNIPVKKLYLNADESSATAAALQCMFGSRSYHFVGFITPEMIRRHGYTTEEIERTAHHSDDMWGAAEDILRISKSEKRYKIVTPRGEYTFDSPSFLTQFHEVCSWFTQEQDGPYFTSIRDSLCDVDVELREGKLVPLAGQDSSNLSVKARNPMMEIALGQLYNLPNELITLILSFCSRQQQKMLSSINLPLKYYVRTGVFTLCDDVQSYTAPDVLRYPNLRQVYNMIVVNTEQLLDDILARRLTYMMLVVTWLSSLDKIVDWILTHDNLEYVEYVGQGLKFSYSPRKNGDGCISVHTDRNEVVKKDKCNHMFDSLRRLPYSTVYMGSSLVDKRLLQDKVITRIEYSDGENLQWVLGLAVNLGTVKTIVRVGEEFFSGCHVGNRITMSERNYSLVEFLAPLSELEINDLCTIFPNVRRVGVFFSRIDAVKMKRKLEKQLELLQKPLSDKTVSEITKRHHRVKLFLLSKKLEELELTCTKKSMRFQKLQAMYPNLELIPMGS